MERVDPTVLKLQTQLFREMSPERKLEIAGQMRDLAWELIAADMRVRFPELTEAEVRAGVRQRFVNVTP